MRDHGSTFQRIRALIILAALLLTTGCGPRSVWGYPADQLSLRLSTGRYAVLASMDFSAQDPNQALRLSPGAPYYLSFVFDSLQMPDQALRMLELAWARSPEPWRREAGVLLGRTYNERKSWTRAVTVARKLLSGPQPPDVVERARRVLVEALYWTQQDQEVEQQAVLLTKPDAEVLLFRGVSSLRLGLPEAHDLIMQLFFRERASALHARFFTFLANAPQYAERFSDVDKDLISAKNDFFLGDWESGIPLMESVLTRLDPAQAGAGTLLADLANAYLSSGRQAAGARFLASASARFTGRARADALEQAGRLYRRAREYPSAFRTLRLAVTASADADQRDRERWYLADMIITLNPPDVIDQVDQQLSAASDPGHFSGLLDDWLSECMQKGKWRTLSALWPMVSQHGPRDVQARLAYVLGRAGEAEVIRASSLPEAPHDLLKKAELADPGGYYGIMAASFLGDVPDQVKPAVPTADAGSPPALDPFITGFLPFGLFSEAYQRFLDARKDLSDAALREAAGLMAQAGDFASSMHLMGILADRRPLSREEMEAEYPRAFSSVIDGLAVTSGIKDSVLYALVREESYFNPDIVSNVGAVGLSQLMPATAEAVARKLHMSEPDLHDPSVNLAIGVRHFQDLLKSVNSVPKALLSYNAGLTRVRAWERAAGNMPQDLFVEAVPFDESRKYVRKILVSAVMYGMLYGNEDPRDAVTSFFGLR